MLEENRGENFLNLHQSFIKTLLLAWIKSFKRVYKGLRNAIQAIEGENKVWK
jgi:hypothetical protein